MEGENMGVEVRDDERMGRNPQQISQRGLNRGRRGHGSRKCPNRTESIKGPLGHHMHQHLRQRAPEGGDRRQGIENLVVEITPAKECRQHGESRPR